jgi:hypothetical protein
MPGETAQEILGTVGPEVVEEEERVEVRYLEVAENPAQPDAGAFGHGFAGENRPDRA